MASTGLVCNVLGLTEIPHVYRIPKERKRSAQPFANAHPALTTVPAADARSVRLVGTAATLDSTASTHFVGHTACVQTR